ncbi:MAG: DNA polymerase III subunit beta, partial [Candidatus Poribacteria bacterium]|nr:DNA polymerase III subunit beta [Candidatus Poribacteria bacterium]
MELTFEKYDLLHALQVLQGVASGRNVLPILSNVLIQATDGNIECVATDLEVGIKIKV